ncbi:MAG: DUF3347 domain-containing protein, partial [Christiangramia sp.]|nr:DUF3347 domain-containing protein [Christiangramia sp.]
MKINVLKMGVVALIIIFMSACKDNKPNQSVEIDTPKEVKKAEKKTADVADQSFIDGMTGKVWHNYLEIKMA